MLGIIRRVFSFSDWQSHHPLEPPPGNMLDASFDAQGSRIAEIQAEVGALLRSDGQLRNGLVTADAVHPAFKAELTDELAAKLRKTTENVEKHALETGSAAFKAELARNIAESAANIAESSKISVLAAESEISTRIQDLTARAEVLNAGFSRTATDLLDLSASVLAGEGSAEAWATTSRLWAEHMPGTIPDEALSESDVSGDHWSSRWWANYAAQIVEDGLGLPGPPGEPGEPGSAGPAGPGVPAGGSTGQVLTKASAADYDSTWMPGGSAPAWADITGKPATFPPTVPIAWTDVSGKPATFPPTLPIASSGVTGLDTAQSAQDTAIAGKAPTVHTHAQADVTGLPAALTARELTANRGVANGYAPLDASTKIASTYLPAYVDDVLEFANLAAFPGSGTAGVIYVAIDTNKVYRWGGSSYTEISPSPGSSDAVPEGSVNLYYTSARAALKLDATHAGTGGTAHANVIAAGAAGFMTGADKTKLDSVATGANNYTHPTGDGNLHVPATGTINNGLFLQAGPTAGSLSWAAASGGGGEPPISLGTTAQYWRGDKSWQTLDKAAVGLSNVDNTADSAKPVSTAQQTAIDGRVADTGDTMTGDFVISKATPQLTLERAASGQETAINFRTGANLRWKLLMDTAAESGNSGAHFRIFRYNDAGTKVDEPFLINRSSAQITTTGSFQGGASVAATTFLLAASATAMPAGGTANASVRLTSTTNFGVFAGSGVPTLSAAQGSIYLRSDGAGTNSRVYVNTNGTTGWSAMSVIAVASSAPSSPATNDVWIDTT